MQTLHFWNSVSEIYEESDLTNHDADSEMKYILKEITGLNITGLICLGVADGCRDPCQILKFLHQQKLPLPKENIYLDLAPKLIEKCKNRIEKSFPNLNALYISDSIHNLDFSLGHVNNHIFIGCYNFNHIDTSFQLYLEQKNVIGTKFEIKFIEYDGIYLLESGNVLKFDINDYVNYVDIMKKIKNNIKNFIACSITTDTGFISHYYDIIGVTDLATNIFGENLKSVSECGDRYILINACNLNENATCNYVTTCLNNVIGNISTYDQIDALQKINSLN